jgi:LemA protein
MIRKLAGLVSIAALLALAGCGYNDLQRQDEGIKAAGPKCSTSTSGARTWCPTSSTPSRVRGAGGEGADRSHQRAGERGRHQGHAELINDPVAFQKFIQAQEPVQGALSRLLVVAEAYPNLKSDALFRDLSAQLEGTENRIAVARNRYIKSVQEYNTTVRSSRRT